MPEDMEKRKQELREMMRARRLKNEEPDTGGADKPAGSEAVLAPQTFRQKWDNYWYHYKWHTIGGAVGLALLISLVCSILGATKYDASLTIVADFPFGSLSEAISGELSELAADATGNGKTELLVTGFQVADEDSIDSIDPQVYSSTIYKLNIWPTSYEYYLYLMDETGYKMMTDMGLVFMDLSESFDSPNVRGDKYYLAGTRLEEKLYTQGMDMFLCFCDYNGYSDSLKSKDKVRRAYENDWALFTSMVGYQ